MVLEHPVFIHHLMTKNKLIEKLFYHRSIANRLQCQHLIHWNLQKICLLKDWMVLKISSILHTLFHFQIQLLSHSILLSTSFIKSFFLKHFMIVFCFTTVQTRLAIFMQSRIFKDVIYSFLSMVCRSFFTTCFLYPTFKLLINLSLRSCGFEVVFGGRETTFATFISGVILWVL